MGGDLQHDSRIQYILSWPLRLSLLAVLEGRFEELWAALGVCCSSWIVTSRGSTGRSWMLPMGNWAYAKVASANCMVTRTTGIVDECVIYWPSPPTKKISGLMWEYPEHAQNSNPEKVLVPT